MPALSAAWTLLVGDGHPLSGAGRAGLPGGQGSGADHPKAPITASMSAASANATLMSSSTWAEADEADEADEFLVLGGATSSTVIGCCLTRKVSASSASSCGILCILLHSP